MVIVHCTFIVPSDIHPRKLFYLWIIYHTSKWNTPSLQPCSPCKPGGTAVFASDVRVMWEWREGDVRVRWEWWDSEVRVMGEWGDGTVRWEWWESDARVMGEWRESDGRVPTHGPLSTETVWRKGSTWIRRDHWRAAPAPRSIKLPRSLKTFWASREQLTTVYICTCLHSIRLDIGHIFNVCYPKIAPVWHADNRIARITAWLLFDKGMIFITVKYGHTYKM